jgi:hypothetical protein
LGRRRRRRGSRREREEEREQAREEEEREQAREEEEREQAGEGEGDEEEEEGGVKEEGEEGRKVKMKSERVGREAEEGHGVWVAMALGTSQPTLALGRNLQLPCRSGLMWKIYFLRLLDDFFGDGAVLVSIFRKVAL